ncbi:MAG: GvpL/GvpF family gas vesicle protein [Cyanobacteriota bacterium]|nr:GvpL/GvpF family gas vesicle protein [Cyanobacteriota bacterium]
MAGLYLYGILQAPGPRHLNVQGIDRQPVQVQVFDPLVLLYSEAQQERYLASRANLLAHESVLEKVMAEGHRALLPLQFGLVASDWELVRRDLIEPKQADLVRLLHHLEGKREVGVKVFWDPDQELQLALNENPDLKRQRDAMAGAPLGLDAVVKIGRELEQLLENRRHQITETFVAILSPLASDRVEGELLTENMAYNGSFLIHWEDEPLFAQKVEDLDHLFQGRLRIRYNNFTAPYNFTKL